MPPATEPWIRARTAPSHDSLGAIVRVGPLSPYLVRMILDDARSAGSHPVVEIEVVGVSAPRLSLSVQRLRRRIELLASAAVRVVIVPSRSGAHAAGRARAAGAR